MIQSLCIVQIIVSILQDDSLLYYHSNSVKLALNPIQRWNCINDVSHFLWNRSFKKKTFQSKYLRIAISKKSRSSNRSCFWQWYNDDLRFGRDVLSLEEEKGRIGEGGKIFYLVDAIRDVIVPPFHGFLAEIFVHASLERKRREEGHFRVKGLARNREGIPTKETEWLITRETGFKDFPTCPRDMNS